MATKRSLGRPFLTSFLSLLFSNPSIAWGRMQNTRLIKFTEPSDRSVVSDVSEHDLEAFRTDRSAKSAEKGRTQLLELPCSDLALSDIRHSDESSVRSGPRDSNSGPHFAPLWNEAAVRTRSFRLTGRCETEGEEEAPENVSSPGHNEEEDSHHQPLVGFEEVQGSGPLKGETDKWKTVSEETKVKHFKMWAEGYQQRLGREEEAPLSYDVVANRIFAGVIFSPSDSMLEFLRSGEGKLFRVEIEVFDEWEERLREAMSSFSSEPKPSKKVAGIEVLQFSEAQQHFILDVFALSPVSARVKVASFLLSTLEQIGFRDVQPAQLGLRLTLHHRASFQSNVPYYDGTQLLHIVTEFHDWLANKQPPLKSGMSDAHLKSKLASLVTQLSSNWGDVVGFECSICLEKFGVLSGVHKAEDQLSTLLDGLFEGGVGVEVQVCDPTSRAPGVAHSVCSLCIGILRYRNRFDGVKPQCPECRKPWKSLRQEDVALDQGLRETRVSTGFRRLTTAQHCWNFLQGITFLVALGATAIIIMECATKDCMHFDRSI